MTPEERAAMSNRDLQGKTVMIATTDRFFASHITRALEDLGASVVFTDRSAHHPSSVSVIADEVEKRWPKIDALIIHNSNIELPEPDATALELTKGLGETRPVIVCDSCGNKTDIQRLRDAGAK
jgi:hypothetical protein